MIKHMKLFIFGVISVAASILLNISFPFGRPIVEILFKTIGLPVYSNNGLQSGFNFAGLTLTFIFINGITYIFYSLKKYRIRAVGLALIIGIAAPSMGVAAYQNTFASGVHAVSYDMESSECSFTFGEERGSLQGICTLPFKNNSSDTVSFTVEFLETGNYKEYGFRMNSLLNEDGPFHIELLPKETKVVQLEANIDVSDVDYKYPQGGGSSHVPIKLMDEKKEVVITR